MCEVRDGSGLGVEFGLESYLSHLLLSLFLPALGLVGGSRKGWRGKGKRKRKVRVRQRGRGPRYFKSGMDVFRIV